MTCPPEIANILREILETGLLSIRHLGWAGNGERCAVEADHIHNLPGLLTDYSPDRLRYYWETERVAYTQQSTAQECAAFAPLWARLAPHGPSSTSRVAAP